MDADIYIKTASPVASNVLELPTVFDAVVEEGEVDGVVVMEDGADLQVVGDGQIVEEEVVEEPMIILDDYQVGFISKSSIFSKTL